MGQGRICSERREGHDSLKNGFGKGCFSSYWARAGNISQKSGLRKDLFNMKCIREGQGRVVAPANGKEPNVS